MDKEKAAQLRAPFKPEQIQKLPTAGTQLDYVSHAWVTDRLLEVDPEWSWEPMAYTEDGLPKFDEQGGLWIRLTVCGVTRIGYGEPQGRDKFDSTKGAIGNALRTAAMRFGVALDLWARESVAPVAKTAPAVKAPAKTASKVAAKTAATAVPEGDPTERVATAFELVTIAGDKEALRTIWNTFADVIDLPHQDTTLRAYIMQRQSEVA